MGNLCTKKQKGAKNSSSDASEYNHYIVLSNTKVLMCYLPTF